MNRYQSVSARSMCSSATQPSNNHLPTVCCPNCGIQLLRLVSTKEATKGMVFYKCPNNNAMRVSKCNMFMWEDEYEKYLHDIGVLAMRKGVVHEVPIAKREET